MRLRASLAAAAAACVCAWPLAAQGFAPGPRLMQVFASASGVVLSIDSSTVAHSGDSTFVADAIYQFPADTSQHVGADRQVESQEMDCAGMRVRGRRTAHYLGDSQVPVSVRDSAQFSTRWEAVNDDERPIVEALCGVLLGSFASLPLTRELWSVDQVPELANRRDVAQEMSRSYPRTARDLREGGQVMLRFRITPEGRAEMIRAIWASREDFANAATHVAELMRFRPAKLGGQPVAVWVTLPVTFDIMDDGMEYRTGPEGRPTGSRIWGGRTSRPTEPIHPDPWRGVRP